MNATCNAAGGEMQILFHDTLVLLAHAEQFSQLKVAAICSGLALRRSTEYIVS